jgi:hypothetical protein
MNEAGGHRAGGGAGPAPDRPNTYKGSTPMKTKPLNAATGDELQAVIHDLMSPISDRAAAIIASALIEYAIEKTIIMRLEINDAGLLDKMTGRDGALNSFYTKTYLGCALGLYNMDVAKEVDIVRGIRNRFAHALESISFESEDISKAVSKLPQPAVFRNWPETFSESRKRYIEYCVTFSIVRLTAELGRKLDVAGTLMSITDPEKGAIVLEGAAALGRFASGESEDPLPPKAE